MNDKLKQFTEVWINNSGEIYTYEYNPCGCCPNDCIVTHAIHSIRPKSWSYSGTTRSGRTRMNQNFGHQRIDIFEGIL